MSEDIEITKDGDRTDYWAPDSDLDSDPSDPGIDYELPDGSHLNVKPNDWLDIDPEFVPDNDPLWGGSRQVISVNESGVVVRMYNPATDLYEPAELSPASILNNYRRVSKT